MEQNAHWLTDLGDGSKTPSPWGSPRMTAPGRCLAQDDDFLCDVDIRSKLHTAPAVPCSWELDGHFPGFPGMARPTSRASTASTQALDTAPAAQLGISCHPPDTETAPPGASSADTAAELALAAGQSTDFPNSAQPGDDVEGHRLRTRSSHTSASSSSQPSRQMTLVDKSKHRNPITEIEFLIAEARIKLEDQKFKVLQVEDAYAKAVEDEKKEWELLVANREANKKRRTEQAIKMQKHVRGLLVRRRFILSIHKQTTEHINWAALLPTHLELHLAQLQHMLHNLQYTDGHYLKACLRLQAWWRMITVRRVYWVLKLRSRMLLLYSKMEKAAVKMQARFRGTSAKKLWYGEICMAMTKKWYEQQADMRRGLRCIIKIQQNLRTKLEARRYAEQRQKLDDEQHFIEEEIMRVSRRTAKEYPEDLSRQLGPPRRDHALQEVEREGLTPFYWRASSHPFVARHRIGGPLALEMQEQIASTAADVTPADSRGGPALDSSNFLEKLPNVYLSGFSPKFVKGLDDDVWPRDSWDRTRPSKNETAAKLSARRPKAKDKANRSSSRRICAAPFSHSAQRADRVRARRTDEPEVAPQQEQEAMPPHPLLVNAPALPLPPGRPSPAARLRHVESASTEECSWPAARRLSPLPAQQTLPLSSAVP